MFFGSLARASLALAEGEPDVSILSRDDFIDFTETSYGQGLIDSVEEIFPELASSALLKRTESVLAKPLEYAKAAFDEGLLAFQRNCQCMYCSRFSDVNCEVVGICLVVLSVTLLELVLALSAVRFETEDKLQPTSQGLKAF